jgi:hypothetical protein
MATTIGITDRIHYSCKEVADDHSFKDKSSDDAEGKE